MYPTHLLSAQNYMAIGSVINERILNLAIEFINDKSK